MQDLFGREVKKGDIIAVSSSKVIGFNSYMKTRLGVVSNILPKREHKKGSWQYNRILNRHYQNTQGFNTSNVNQVFGSTISKNPLSIFKSQILPSIAAKGPDSYEVCEKITFHPFDIGFTGASNKTNKDGTPRVRPHLTNSFIILDECNLSQEWQDSYNKIKQIFKIS